MREVKTYEPGGPCYGESRVAVDRVRDDLHAERWCFGLFLRTTTLYLENYYRLERPTKRHAWRIVESYDHLVGRRTGPAQTATPPHPDDVMREAKDTFVARVTVGMWNKENA